MGWSVCLMACDDVVYTTWINRVNHSSSHRGCETIKHDRYTLMSCGDDRSDTGGEFPAAKALQGLQRVGHMTAM